MDTTTETPYTTSSFPAATFLVARGFAPLSVAPDTTGIARVVYSFAPAARAAVREYYAVRDLLEKLTDAVVPFPSRRVAVK